MANYKMRVNTKFKGEITLPSVDYPLKGGNVVILNEEQFNGSDIQAAIKKGFLVNEEQISDEPKYATVKAPNYIDEETDDDADVDIDPRDYEVSTKATAWDPETNRGLGVKEARRKALNQVNSLEMEVATGNNIDFSNDKEENEDVEAEEVVRKPKGVRSPKDQKKSAVKKEAKILPMPSDNAVELAFPKEEPIGFVDQEQTIERVSKHPILKKSLQSIAKDLAIEEPITQEVSKPVVKRGRKKKVVETNNEVE